MVVRRYIGYWNDFINAFNRGFNLLKENMVVKFDVESGDFFEL